MKTTMKFALASLILLLTVSSCSRMAPGGTLPNDEGETALAEVGPLTATVGATGSVRPEQLQMLTFKTSGTVDQVLVEVGDTVRKGERLAVLRDASLPASVLMARADLVAAERELENVLHSRAAAAEAQLAVANAQDALEDAQYVYRVRQEGNRATADTVEGAKYRLREAKDRLEGAQDAYDSARGDAEKLRTYDRYASARTAYNNALATYNWYTGHPTEIEQAQLEADVALAQARLDDAVRAYERVKDGPNPDDIAAAEARVAAAQAALQQAWIEAPFSGTITAVEVQPGDQVGAGTVAFQLADLSQLLVDVDVSEVDINRVEPGQLVELTFDAVLDRRYQGTVTEVDLVGSETQGVVNYKVTVAIEDADALVRPGLTAAVNLVVDQIDDALLVPNRAVRVVDGQRVVYVLRDGQMTAVPIVLGTSSESHSQVLEGDLGPGDTILLNPPTTFDTNGPPGGTFFGRR
jgi:HlyD family secretion protein